MVRIVVTGHTDTVGSLAYNQRLSERRADAVKTEIIREGLNAADITTVGRNFAEPLVPTGPGVREPQKPPGCDRPRTVIAFIPGRGGLRAAFFLALRA
jgi:hypothetical protein